MKPRTLWKCSIATFSEAEDARRRACWLGIQPSHRNQPEYTDGQNPRFGVLPTRDVYQCGAPTRFGRRTKADSSQRAPTRLRTRLRPTHIGATVRSSESCTLCSIDHNDEISSVVRRRVPSPDDSWALCCNRRDAT